MLHRLTDIVARSAATDPQAPAVTYKDRTLTYGELWDETTRFASALLGLGVERGDRVAVYLDKRVETVTTIFGASASGGVFVPINPLLRPQQVGFILSDCDVKVLVTSSDRLASLEEELDRCKSIEHVVLIDAGTTGIVGHYSVTRWSELIETSPPSSIALPGTDHDMAAIMYTSGSTGSPKGVVLSHRNLIVGAESVSHYLGLTGDDVILAALPLSFDAGLSQLTISFLKGAHVILMNYLLPGEVVRLCARHQVTGLTCVPPLWIQLAGQDWPPESSRHLRHFANTGGRMPRTTLERLRAIFPQARPFLMYGLTEAFRSTFLDPSEVDRRPDSIGKAIPNVEIMVVRPDGTPCDPGEEGELVHRGPLVALGYWNDPERTAERFRPAPGTPEGVPTTELAVWSGDSVVLDEEGFLYFVGRADDMIKTSGYRVSPTEIEEVVYETGLVQEAAALGVDNEQLGQTIAVVVSPLPGFEPETLRTELKRKLPLYMVPRDIVVRSGLPRSANGKIDRGLLAQELNARGAQ